MSDYGEHSMLLGARLSPSRVADTERQQTPKAKRKLNTAVARRTTADSLRTSLPSLMQAGQQGLKLSPTLARDTLHRLQRSHGNQYVRRILQRSGDTGGDVSPDVERAIESSRGGGHPLDSGMQSRMGRALDADFSGVRVHSDSEADGLNRSLQARAFTTGKDVYFRHGEYNPGSSSGRQLLAHELTHVVQQGGSTVQSKSQEGDRDAGCSGCAATNLMRTVQAKLTVGAPNDIYEQEADNVANAYANWERQPSPKGNAGSPLQRQETEEEKKKESMLQTKPDSSRLFRQTEEEKKEPLRAKADDNALQRQPEEEDEEPVQTKLANGELQRQEALEEKEKQSMT
jgi:hypothetical protein